VAVVVVVVGVLWKVFMGLTVTLMAI